MFIGRPGTYRWVVATASTSLASSNLWLPTASLGQFVSLFSRKGLNTCDMTALFGAHTSVLHGASPYAGAPTAKVGENVSWIAIRDLWPKTDVYTVHHSMLFSCVLSAATKSC
jgi:hypothetical protein